MPVPPQIFGAGCSLRGLGHFRTMLLDGSCAFLFEFLSLLCNRFYSFETQYLFLQFNFLKAVFSNDVCNVEVRKPVVISELARRE